MDFRPWKEILLVHHATPSTVLILHDLAPRQKKKIDRLLFEKTKKKAVLLVKKSDHDHEEISKSQNG